MRNDDMIDNLRRVTENKFEEGREDIKDQILRHIKDGKDKLILLEQRITGGPKVQKLLKEARLSKVKLVKARKIFDQYEKKAEKYVEKNPKKAVAMAIAAGVLAGALWSSLNSKSSSPKRKGRISPKKRRPSTVLKPVI